MTQPPPLQIEHNAEQSRFEANVDGKQGVADYVLRRDVMVLTHTFVPNELRGQGVAAALMRAALDHARAHHLRVDPRCSYAEAYVSRHPEVRDLLLR